MIWICILPIVIPFIFALEIGDFSFYERNKVISNIRKMGKYNT